MGFIFDRGVQILQLKRLGWEVEIKANHKDAE
jgi:hypothetical protein